MSKTDGARPWLKLGIAIAVIAIVLAVSGWFFVWASGEYRARGGQSASLGFLYLPESARKERSVFSLIAVSLWNRGLACGAAAVLLSIVAIVLNARSGVAAIVFASTGLAVVLLPAAFFLLRFLL